MLERLVKERFKRLLKNTRLRVHANTACAGGEAGWPDFDIIYGPMTLRVECKGKGGSLRPHQERLLRFLDAQGIPVALLEVKNSHLEIRRYPRGDPYRFTSSEDLEGWILNALETPT